MVAWPALTRNADSNPSEVSIGVYPKPGFMSDFDVHISVRNARTKTAMRGMPQDAQITQTCAKAREPAKSGTAVSYILFQKRFKQVQNDTWDSG